MIDPDCKDCEMLDLENEEFPCKLELTGSVLRCTILNQLMKDESRKREMVLWVKRYILSEIVNTTPVNLQVL